MPLADKWPDRTDPDQLCHFLLFRLCRALACPPAPRLLGSLWVNRRGAQFFHCCSHDVRLCSPLTLLFLLSVSFPLWSHPFVPLLLLLGRSVVSDSLWPHGLQHARPPCPSRSPRVYSNLCPWSQWCHPTISSSVVPFSSSLQPFPASGFFPVSWLFTSGGQSIGASASVNDSDLWIPLYFMSLDPTVLYVSFSHQNRTSRCKLSSYSLSFEGQAEQS